MTAEIVIMNKEAIALATDSAVTMGQEKRQKIFASANKLFTLSKYYPVGIMIYGQASFMGIPWESIIKIYRNKWPNYKGDSLINSIVDIIFTLIGILIAIKNPLSGILLVIISELILYKYSAGLFTHLQTIYNKTEEIFL